VHFPGAATAASETTTAITASATPVAVSVATPVRISSVIKTHLCFTSVYSRYPLGRYKNKIVYNSFTKNKNEVFNNRLYDSLFLLPIFF
jgi:hypothetical protein